MNHDFEESINNLPTYWNLFVLPQDGSYGKIDCTTAYSGQCSVMLHNTQTYPEEPLNNWNQRIDKIKWEDNTSLTLQGFIKTTNATKSYISIQCWQKSPAKILNTFVTDHLTQTQGWKKVNLDIQIPNETDFIMVRCILEGTGSAWFDNITLTIPGKGENNKNSKDNSLITKPKETIITQIKNLEEQIISLKKENEKLRERLDEQRKHNEALKKELIQLKKEIEKEKKLLETNDNIISN